MARAVGRSILAGYYRLARLGFLTPLRVRINLVAKEFVASQNQTYPCVLILSRFAEAADKLPEALTVNPFDIEEIADRMHVGLIMPL